MSKGQDRHDTPIVVDSVATFSVSPFIEDLIPGTVEEVKGSVQNLSSSSRITVKGFARWTVLDANGKVTHIEPLTHIVPDASI